MIPTKPKTPSKPKPNGNDEPIIKIRIRKNAYNSVYGPFFEDNRRLQIFFGGSSSGKSYFLASRVVLDAIAGRNTLVCRAVAGTLRGSCWNEIVKAIGTMGVEQYFDALKTSMLITCNLNGAQIIFAGLDDVEKIKSITPANGVLTDVWVEEATEISRNDWKQLEKRLRGRSDHTKRITLSFNPISKVHWIFKEFFGAWDDTKNLYEDEGMLILKTTYKDNKFLMPDDIKGLLTEKDDYYREVYTLGNWGVLGGSILKDYVRHDFDIGEYNFDAMALGADWGYNHATAILLLGIKDGEIYICKEIYEFEKRQQEIIDIAEINRIPKHLFMWCDSATPEAIQQWRYAGYRARPVEKEKGSIQSQIQWLKNRKIHIHPSCTNTYLEIQQWQWSHDKRTGAFEDVPQEGFDDAMAALRYGIEGWRKKRRFNIIDTAGGSDE